MPHGSPAGFPVTPLRVTVTRSGDLDPGARIFTEPGTGTVVYAEESAAARLTQRLGDTATVVARGTRRRPGLGPR